jgi:endonuclease-8
VLAFFFGEVGIRIHFLMFGSYRINEQREGMTPRLSLQFGNGFVNFYNCSARRLPKHELLKMLDHGVDICHTDWKLPKVLTFIQDDPHRYLCDILLDQDIFAGVGNIIKNEALFAARLHPLNTVGQVPEKQLERLAAKAREFSRYFYERSLENKQLGAGLRVYRKRQCSECMTKIQRKRLGETDRVTFFCSECQVLYG